MTTERFPERPPSANPPTDETAARRALRVQLLSVEHWSLLATRSMSWNESFTRAGMFLTLLTGSIVALALVAQATDFGQGFVLFAVLLLPVVLFIGVATYVRLVEVNNEDVTWVRGMNRLRRAYLELDPGIEEYLVTGWTEDPVGLLRTYGAHDMNPSMLHGLVTTPAMIGFVNAMLAAVLGGLIFLEAGLDMTIAAVGGGVVFVLVVAASWLFALRASVGFFVRRTGGPAAGPVSREPE